MGGRRQTAKTHRPEDAVHMGRLRQAALQLPEQAQESRG
jgi:hypothetical protein